MNQTQDFLKQLCTEYKNNNYIDPDLYRTQNVKRGLRNADGTGVLTGLTLVGDVVGYDLHNGRYTPIDGKLYYRGYDLYDLVNGFKNEGRYGFEEISYLLLFGQLPTSKQLDVFTNMLSLLRFLPDRFAEDVILRLPSKNIMNMMARSTLALYAFDENPDDTSLENLIRQSIELISRFPVLLTYAYQAKRHFFDKKSLYLHFPKESESTAETILRTLRKDKQFTKEEAKLLDLCLTVHAEHGGGNNSTFTCRSAASTGTDTYSAIAAAVGCLNGPRHGGATIKAAKMLEEIQENVENTHDEGQVADYLNKILRKEAGDGSGLIYGMGHAVYTLSDPRARLLKTQAKELTYEKGFGDLLDLAETVEKITPELFAGFKGANKKICANVDLYSGIVYKTLGITDDLIAPIFATARMAGWCAHRIEEITSNSRIIRPAYLSVADTKEYISMNNR